MTLYSSPRDQWPDPRHLKSTGAIYVWHLEPRRNVSLPFRWSKDIGDGSYSTAMVEDIPRSGAISQVAPRHLWRRRSPPVVPAESPVVPAESPVVPAESTVVPAENPKALARGRNRLWHRRGILHGRRSGLPAIGIPPRCPRCMCYISAESV